MMLGQRIKEERERRDWTQTQLADTLHVSRQAISKWELGTAYPDIERLIQISDLFSVSLDNLIKGDTTFQEKIVVTDHQHQRNFWWFIAKYWWMIFPVGGFLYWLIPALIHGIVVALR
ncbi:MAG TPA: transcriptional regulator [Lactobacillus sp.]|nr:transcriptional regulator [Lactobacillus sp.]